MDELTGPILVVNVGSSSLKLRLFDGEAEQELGLEELTWASQQDPAADSLRRGVRSLLARHERVPLAAVGHRVVHGGDRYSASVLIDEAVKRDIRELSALAPLHNPRALAAIEAVEELMPGIRQVAAFDTAFHATMAPTAYLYPVPYYWYESWGIRRFGFHGLSHAYCAGRAADLLGRPLAELRLIVCHLGAGCSLAAIREGRSVATTMGFTPLDGVPMATRPGSLDPGILLHLLRSDRLSLDEAEQALEADSGLRGLSGLSGDMRELLAARTAGNERTRLALEVFTARVRECIGALAVALGGLDVLVFTAGIGEHAPAIRAEICQPLRWLGVELDVGRNNVAHPDVTVASETSAVRILVVRTREELMVARETRQVLARQSA